MSLHPCGSCPYRKDVPSGVWAEHEYDKLPAYDAPTFAQPHAAFFCHQRTGDLCAGWVGCHDMDDSLGLRLAFVCGAITEDAYREALRYESPVPLWESGQAARDHGVAEVAAPSAEADRVIGRLRRKLGEA